MVVAIVAVVITVVAVIPVIASVAAAVVQGSGVAVEAVGVFSVAVPNPEYKFK